jgi:hypothetical protein
VVKVIEANLTRDTDTISKMVPMRDDIGSILYRDSGK